MKVQMKKWSTFQWPMKVTLMLRRGLNRTSSVTMVTSADVWISKRFTDNSNFLDSVIAFNNLCDPVAHIRSSRLWETQETGPAGPSVLHCQTVPQGWGLTCLLLCFGWISYWAIWLQMKREKLVLCCCLCSLQLPSCHILKCSWN